VGRRGWIGWGSAFAVSGVLWLIAQSWEAGSGAPAPRQQTSFVACPDGLPLRECMDGHFYQEAVPGAVRDVVSAELRPHGPADSECARARFDEACVEVWPRERSADQLP
jgi:hypothetical protein